MSIHSHIEHLKTKPEHIKKQIAFWSAFGITFVIFAFWVASYTAAGKNAEQSVTHAVAQAGSPAQSLVASVGGFFGDIKDLMFKPRTVTYTDIQVTPGK
jgi:hypothetical protein